MKKAKLIQNIIMTIVFVFSSIILFVNNLTDFFSNMGIFVKVNIIVWIGMCLDSGDYIKRLKGVLQ